MKNKRFSLYQTNKKFYDHIQKVSGIENTLGDDVILSSFPERILISLDKDPAITRIKKVLDWGRRPIDIMDLNAIAEECAGEGCSLTLDKHGSYSIENLIPFMETCHSFEIPLTFNVYDDFLTHESIILLKEYECSVCVIFRNNNGLTKLVEKLLDADIPVEIQYAFSVKTLNSAILFLEKQRVSTEVGQITFTIEKPSNFFSGSYSLKKDSYKKWIKKLIELANNEFWHDKVRFSPCFSMLIFESEEKLELDSQIQNCDAGLFSAYISSDMYFSPCAMDTRKRWAIDLRKTAIQTAWSGVFFDFFRQSFVFSYKGCSKESICQGECPMGENYLLVN